MLSRIRHAERLYLYIFALFIVMKMWRAFSGSSEAGGIWNYIQIFYAASGTLAFVKYSPLIIRQKSVFWLGIFSFWALLVSFISIPQFSVSGIFNLVKALVPGMVLAVFYVYGMKVKDITDFAKTIKIMFYVAAVILFVPLAKHMLSGGYRASGAGAVADVYYLLTLFPLMLVMTDRKRWSLPILVTAACVLVSQKRTGLLAFVGAILIVYLLIAVQENNIKSALKNIVSFGVLAAIGFFLCRYMDHVFRLNIIERLMKLETDGGGGRESRWLYILYELQNSDILQTLFGHGYRSTTMLVGGFAHNDFLQVFYEYGLVGFLLYVSYFVSAITSGMRMMRDKYTLAPFYFAAILIALFIAMFSFYVVDATYVISACFVQGVILADWNKQRSKPLEHRKASNILVWR